jgi:hypothetical protein
MLTRVRLDEVVAPDVEVSAGAKDWRVVEGRQRFAAVRIDQVVSRGVVGRASPLARLDTLSSDAGGDERQSEYHREAGHGGWLVGWLEGDGCLLSVSREVRMATEAIETDRSRLFVSRNAAGDKGVLLPDGLSRARAQAGPNALTCDAVFHMRCERVRSCYCSCSSRAPPVRWPFEVMFALSCFCAS